MLVSKECYERGCSCYDDRVDKDPVEVIKAMKLNNIPIQNKERDKAWEAFIKRKDVKALMKENSDFKFPLDGSYEMWCIAWDKAWATAQESTQEPKEWVGLTEIEICDIEADELTSASSETFSFARAIEAKLKEKNGG
jgi:hypothetical protein